MKQDLVLLKVILVHGLRDRWGGIGRCKLVLTHPTHHRDVAGLHLALALSCSASCSSSFLAALVTTVNPASPLEAEAWVLKRLCRQPPSVVPGQLDMPGFTDFPAGSGLSPSTRASTGLIIDLSLGCQLLPQPHKVEFL